MKHLFHCFLIVFVLLQSAQAQINLNQGLIGCYSFSGNAQDSSGGNYHGNITGASLTTDRYGRLNHAYEFNGQNYIEIPANQLKNNTYTFSLWAFPTIAPQIGETFRLLSIGGTGGDQNIDLSNQYFGFTGWDGGGYDIPNNTVTAVTTGSLPVLNKWYHIVITREVSIVKLYVDGQLIAAQNNNKPPFWGNAPTKAIIGGRSVLNQFYRGKIDDIALYNRVLSDTEVGVLYNQPPCGVQPSPAQFTATEPGYISMEGNSYTAKSIPTSDKRTFLQLRNNALDPSSLVGISLSAGSNTNPTVLEHVAREYTYPLTPSPFAGFGQLYSRDNGLILRTGSPSSPNGVIKFMTGNLDPGNFSLERMRIDANGNLGIGTQNPKSKVQVTSGDVYVENPDRGIILKSPNGTCWRVTIDDSGNFVRTSIACP
jgi:Concanavalin A-like lectin/glucanases superfamily